jgi:hypothetical protein
MCVKFVFEREGEAAKWDVVYSELMSKAMEIQGELRRSFQIEAGLPSVVTITFLIQTSLDGMDLKLLHDSLLERRRGDMKEEKGLLAHGAFSSRRGGYFAWLSSTPRFFHKRSDDIRPHTTTFIGRKDTSTLILACSKRVGP